MRLRNSCLFQSHEFSNWWFSSPHSFLQTGLFSPHIFFVLSCQMRANRNEHKIFLYFSICCLSYKFITWSVSQMNCREQFCELFYHCITWIAIFPFSDSDFLNANIFYFSTLQIINVFFSIDCLVIRLRKCVTRSKLT